MIQRPVQGHTQAAGGPRRPTVPGSAQQTTSVPSLQINKNSSAPKETENRKVIQTKMVTYLTVSMRTDHLQ